MAGLKITPVETLKTYAEGEIIELPPFAEGQPFIARIKRPSLMILMKSGKIPNSLLSTASALFNGTTNKAFEENDHFMADLLDVLTAVAEASLIAPTLKEINEAGLELTDEQYMFIFNYSQEGIKALESFRK
jgi:hypothetical protein